MKIIEPSVEIIDELNGMEILKKLEMAGRTCYKSEDKIDPERTEDFIFGIIQRGHHTILEHFSFSARFICDRGVSHELVRHRLATFSQESTRYCNYSQNRFGGEITVIKPSFFDEDTKAFELWKNACLAAEKAYFELLDWGCTPQEARSVLPNSLKTELVMTCNLREWLHFFRLRALGITGQPHPQMKELAWMLLKQVDKKIPVVFSMGSLLGV